MLRDHLRQAGMFDLCGAGIVLTGGGSRLPGIFDVAESVLRRPCGSPGRRRWPRCRRRWPSPSSRPCSAWCSTATAPASPAARRKTAWAHEIESAVCRQGSVRHEPQRTRRHRRKSQSLPLDETRALRSERYCISISVGGEDEKRYQIFASVQRRRRATTPRSRSSAWAAAAATPSTA